MSGRNHVLPDDIQALFAAVVGVLLASLPLMFPVRSPAAMAALRPRYAAPGAYR